MRRYGRATDGTIVAGKIAGLKLALSPQTECAEPVEIAVEPCAVAIDGLYWFSDESGAFDATVEAAYLLPEGEGVAGPVMAVAGLLGESCEIVITWSTEWTPEDEDGAAPGIYEDEARLIVYSLADTSPGILSVTAQCDNMTYGPILLTLLRYVCYDYYYCPPCSGMELEVTALNWENNAANITQSAAGPWAHVISVRGQWPSGTTFNWSPSWSGSGSETPTYLAAGPALGVFRPSGHTSTGNVSVAVGITPPGKATVWSNDLVGFSTLTVS